MFFTKAQADKCNDITVKGKRTGVQIQDLKKSVEDVKKDIEKANAYVDTITTAITKLKAEFVSLPVVDVAAVVPGTIPEWVEKQAQIKDIEATIKTGQTKSPDTSEAQERKSELNNTRDDLKKKLANRDAIRRYEKEIASLEKKGKDLAQQIADVEKEEYTIGQFTKVKINECESRVNAIFKVVSFKLYDYTNDGNPVETCIPTIGGVPFGSANTAGRMNAGLDIINTLCKFYGVCVPIFIDNRESVNEIIPTTSQIINLVVTNDDCLTIR